MSSKRIPAFMGTIRTSVQGSMLQNLQGRNSPNSLLNSAWFSPHWALMTITGLICIIGLSCLSVVILVFIGWDIEDTLTRNAGPSEMLNPSADKRYITSRLNRSHPDESSHWKISELRKLGKLVQRRLSYLQNPKNCTAARKVLCRQTSHGFGSNLHQLTFCLIVAYATQRTLILESKGWKYAKEGWETMFLPLSGNCTSTMNHKVTITKNLSNIAHIKVIGLPLMQHLSYRPKYLPLAIPEDLADNLTRVHRNPSVWWVGQFVKYLTRPKRTLQNHFQQRQKKLVFKRPVVGIHVRRTDKKLEADYHRLEEYMKHVDKWFNIHVKNDTKSRYIYLATDNPDVLKEAQNKYPNYTFIHDAEASITAKRTRYTESSLQGILFDVHMLSMCDFVICTMSSNVGRLVYELMQSRDGEASNRLLSLDTDYYFNQKAYVKQFVQSFKQNGTSGVNMKGFALVNDKRSNPSRPIFTADNKIMRVAMPVYSERKQLEPNQTERPTSQFK